MENTCKPHTARGIKKALVLLAALLLPGLALTGCGNAQPAVSPISTGTPPLMTGTPPQGPLPALQAITVENADRAQLLRTMEIPGYSPGQFGQCSLDFSPDGDLLVGACGRNQAPVWEVKSGLLLRTLYTEPQAIVTCAFSPDGSKIACGGFDKALAFWNVETGEQLSSFAAHDSPVWDLAFSPDGQRLVSCSLSSDIRLWEAPDGGMVWSYAKPPAYLSVAFSPDGETIAYGGRWGKAGILDGMTGASVIELIKINNPIGDVAFSPLGKFLAAATDSKNIYLWSRDDYHLVAILEGHQHYVNGVSFNPDETLLASGSHDKTVGIWDIASQQRIKTLAGHGDVVLRVAFSPDGTLIASISWDGSVRLWGVPGEQ